jgi:hypothetical protein
MPQGVLKEYPSGEAKHPDPISTKPSHFLVGSSTAGEKQHSCHPLVLCYHLSAAHRPVQIRAVCPPALLFSEQKAVAEKEKGSAEQGKLTKL